MKLVLTCEHAGNFIPEKYQDLFKGKKGLLESHRGYDPGALDLFNFLKPLAHYSNHTTISRLLIEVNRSLHHPDLFSELLKHESDALKNELITTYYLPYRNEVEQNIRAEISTGKKILHLSVHSFTLVLHGKSRTNNIGLLYDPSRKREKQVAHLFKEKLQQLDSSLTIRMNYPYLGKADGLTTYLRKKFPHKYMGIEIEINQGLLHKEKFPRDIKNAIHKAIVTCLMEN